MRIICTVINDLSYDQRMIRICSTLQEAGHEVLLLGRVKRRSVPLVERVFRQKRLRCWFYDGKLFYLEYHIRLLLFLLSHRFDVVNAVDLDTLLPGYLATKAKGKPLVYDAHEYFTEQPEIVTRPAVQRVWKRLERWLLPRVDQAYTVCASLAELFEEEYGLHFGVVRNVPFQKPLPAPQKPNSPKILLYQGSLNEGRGLEEMMEAMSYIEGAEFWLAGEGEQSEELRQKCKEMQLGSKVKFLGYLQPEELARITPLAHIGLNLLQNKGLNYYYSLANKSFDYIQALVPSINMDFPEYRKIHEEHEVSLLIPDLKADTLVQAVNRLLHDEVFYAQIKENCRKASQVYVWEKEKMKLLPFYAQPLNISTKKGKSSVNSH